MVAAARRSVLTVSRPARRPLTQSRSTDMAGGRLAEIKDIALEVKDQLKQDNVPVASAGVAFFGFLALFPAMAATISIYGLVRSPDEITDQINDVLESAPESTRLFLSDQLSEIASSVFSIAASNSPIW